MIRTDVDGGSGEAGRLEKQMEKEYFQNGSCGV
jgi:hypothetical protein